MDTRVEQDDNTRILHGPVVINDIEIHICRCPPIAMRELTHVFPAQISIDRTDILAIPTNQRSSIDLVKVGGEVELEKDRCLEHFMEFGRSICEILRNQGYFADFIDPCSGLPMLSKDTNKVYSEVDGMQTFLNYRTMDAGMCKVLLHPKWGSAVYPASVFTDAPLHTALDALSRIRAYNERRTTSESDQQKESTTT